MINVKTFGRGLRLFGIALAAAITFVGVAAGQENTGKVQQGLVGGSVVKLGDRERYGLLTLGTGCSASLLRNNWVITAAHCIDNPDPSMRGRFITVAENSVTLTADWNSPQVRQSSRIISFRPYDIAIIRVTDAFVVNGSNVAYNRGVYLGDELESQSILVLGRGINQFATGSGDNATPSSGDDTFRLGIFTITNAGNGLYSFPRTNGQTVAGGDSGGPSFIRVNDDYVLVGVHQSCTLECLEGKTCGAWPGPGPAPADYSNWKWVSGTKLCHDSRVRIVWDDIDRYLGAFVPPDPNPPIAPPGPTIVPAFIYGIDSQGRLQWYRHDGARTGKGLETPGAWQGARPVGQGWDGLKHVFPGAGNVIYAITQDGTLNWYQHKGFNTGLGVGSVGSWEGPRKVGRGWDGFTHVFSGGDGIIYAITPDGRLWWYKHVAYRTGGALEEPGAWEGRTVVGRGWEGFTHVFSTGGGVIYAVTPDGRLWWYRHKAYLTGGTLETPGAWEGRTVVGRGWDGFKQVFSAGDGIIYAVSADGRLWWYRHKAFMTGGLLETPGAWEGRAVIGQGWGDFSEVFALLPATPDVVR